MTKRLLLLMLTAVCTLVCGQVYAQQPANALRVGVMLPLHDNDGDGRRMTEYYRGMLLACSDLKAQGYTISVKAWNVPSGADIRTTLLEPGAQDLDILFGPLYSAQVAPLGEFCKAHDIRLVIPFSISGDDVDTNSHIWQVYQSDETLTDRAVKAFLQRFTNVHPIIVNCNDSLSRKGAFTSALRQKLDSRAITYSLTDINTPVEQMAKAFDRSKQNVVILNSARSPMLNRVIAKLDQLTAQYPGIVISLFGYNEWLMYAPYGLEKFFKYDTYVPSTFYVNQSNAKTVQLEQAYKRWFHANMMYALPRFALTGYDQTMFFLQGLRLNGKKFTGVRGQSTYTPVQTPLYFVKSRKGGYRNANFQLIHYTFNKNIESIQY